VIIKYEQETTKFLNQSWQDVIIFWLAIRKGKGKIFFLFLFFYFNQTLKKNFCLSVSLS